MGDLTRRVFDKTPVCFRPDSLKGYNEPDADGVIRLVNGRIILKKITFALLSAQRQADGNRERGVQR